MIIICPNCNDFIEIIELKCCIFRHGVYKETGEQINPHMSKEDCDYLITNNKIYGCGKPFKIISINNNYNQVISCDYE